MSNQKRLEAIENLRLAHEEFLTVTMTYLSPDERKPLAEKSMKEFTQLMAKYEAEESGDTDAQINAATEIIKTTGNMMKYPKGGCSLDCIRAMIRIQQRAMVAAARSDLPPEAVAGIGELCNGIMTECIAGMISMANNESERHWQVRDKVHALLDMTTKSLTQMFDTIKAGRILALKIPRIDTKEAKQFMN